MPTINAIKTKELNRRLEQPFNISLGAVEEISNVMLAVEVSDGTVGIDVAAAIVTISNESQVTIKSSCNLAKELLASMDIMNVRGIMGG